MANSRRAVMGAAVMVVLAGCTGMSVVQRNVVPIDEKPRRCVAAGNDRNACAQYASQRCAGGFDVFEKDVPGDDGVVRRIYHYQCL